MEVLPQLRCKDECRIVGRKEIRMTKTITLVLDYHAGNVLEYLKDKYHTDYAHIIVDALNAYYAEDIKELELEWKEE